MVKCKYCGNPLYTTPLGSKCRMCGKQAGFFRGMAATPTLTQGGANRAVRQHKKNKVRELEAKVAKIQRKFDRDLEALHTTPVTDGLHGMTWQAAEIMARDWMKKKGHIGAKLTNRGADGGIDVESITSIAQVKHHASPVGIAEMQRLYGIAQSTKKKALFFSASGYSGSALKWAAAHKIACYTYPPITKVSG